MHGRVQRFLRDEGGATAIEYGIVVALIFLVIITSVRAFATNVTAMFTKVASNV
jgi:pilus assembly protein Flp/PilA